MGVISGKGGAVNGQSVVRKWNIAYKSDLAAYASSNTGGIMSQLAGNTDWNGGFQAYGDTPLVLPGDALSFVGSMEGTKGASGTAIVDQVEISVDLEGAKPVEYNVNFSGNGVLSQGAAVASDASLTIPGSSIGCKVATGTVVASPVWTDLADIRNWKLTLTAANKEYASSSSAGGKKRVKGNVDAAFSFSMYGDDLSLLPQPNSIAAYRFYVSPTTYWEVLWGIVGDEGDITADIEGGELVGATINGKFRAITLVTAAATRGSIKKPGGSTWYPW